MDIEIAKRIIFRYTCATIWIILLVGFSYTTLLTDFFDPSHHIGFENKLIEIIKSPFVLFSNTGLVGLLFFDDYITRKIIKAKDKPIGWGWLASSIFVVIILYLYALGIKKGMDFPDWFHIYYIFAVFLILLLFYKAEILNIKR